MNLNTISFAFVVKANKYISEKYCIGNSSGSFLHPITFVLGLFFPLFKIGVKR